jgi:pyruvate dehydrogenase E2 component (dihydrolipoamide acetyltransferase)
MATNIILPALGMAQETGRITEWLKAEGEQITQGEPLAVIETDKAAVDLEAPASGVLAHLSAAGTEVPVGAVIGVILAAEEVAAGNATAPLAPAVNGAAAAPSVQATPSGRGSPVAEMAIPSAPTPGGAPGRPLASPKARRLAAECGQDLARIAGSGPGGAVLAADVLAAATGPLRAGTLPTAIAPMVEVATEAPTAAAPAAQAAISAIWRLMAERTTQSWTSVPHFFLVREARADHLIAWRTRALGETAEPITYTDLLVKVVAEALRRHPRVNASWDGGAVVTHDEVNVALAVAIEDGLVAPVIHTADGLSLAAVARRRQDLVSRAQSGRLRPRDLQDGTFTISNLGMYGVDAFNAIINAPQAAILAVGRIAECVVPVDGQPAVRPMLTLSLSCDHRVVDGARGAQFLATVAELVEDPSSVAR